MPKSTSRTQRTLAPWGASFIIALMLGLVAWQLPTITKLQGDEKWLVFGPLFATIALGLVVMSLVRRLSRERRTAATNAEALAEIYHTSLPVALLPALFLFLVEVKGEHGENVSRWTRPIIDGRTFTEGLEELTRKMSTSIIRSRAKEGEPPYNFPKATPRETQLRIGRMLQEASRKTR